MSRNAKAEYAVYISDLACARVLLNLGYVEVVDDSAGRDNVRVTNFSSKQDAEVSAVRIRQDARRFMPEPKVEVMRVSQTKTRKGD